MWFRSLVHALARSSRRRGPLRRPGARRLASRRWQARRLWLEGLEDRSLMAFNMLAEYATGAQPYSPYDVKLADVSGDGRPDMIVTNHSGKSIEVRLGNVGGAFGAAQSFPTGGSPLSLAVGDFNGDLLPDVATVNGSDVSLSLLLGHGNGSFDPPQNISLPGQIDPHVPDIYQSQQPTSIATGDLNDDGNLDLVVPGYTVASYQSYGYYYSSYRGYINVLIGNGSGGFAAPAVSPLGDRLPSGVAVGDLNHDDADDVVASNGYASLSVLPGNGDGTLAAAQESGSGPALRSLSLGDVDGDGNLDALLGDYGNGLSVQKGDGAGHFTAQNSVYPGTPVHAAVMGDVNHDGQIDLVAVGSTFTCTSHGYYGCYDGYSTRVASVLIGNGQGGFAVPLDSYLGATFGLQLAQLPAVALADLTGDNLPELVTVDQAFSEALVATNNGDWNPPPSIVISGAVTVVEGNSGTINAVFTVSVVGDHSDTVSVSFATGDISATAGADYTSTFGTLTFGPTESTKTISVPIKGDTIDEFDEQFVVNLSNALGGVINNWQGVATIADDDAAPLITINDVSKSEGNNGLTTFTFTVSLSAVSGKWVSVNYATVNGTATTADSDYNSTSSTVWIAPGQTTATITMTVRGDKRKEANETFFVNLTAADGGTISDSQGVGTIINDDGGAGGGKGKPTKGR